MAKYLGLVDSPFRVFLKKSTWVVFFAYNYVKCVKSMFNFCSGI